MWGGGERERRKTNFSSESLLSFFCPLSFVHSFLILLLYQTGIVEIAPKQTPATQGSRLHDVFTDLHKFPCLVTSHSLGTVRGPK